MTNTTPPEDSVHFAVQLWRRRRFFLLVFVPLMLAFVALVLLWPASYSTSGAVIIGSPEPSNSPASALNEKIGDPADLEGQLLIAKSPRMLRLTLQSPGVAEGVKEECEYRNSLSYAFAFQDCGSLKLGSQDLFDYVASRYLVRAEGRSRVISMGYRSPLPEVAFIMTNALLITYLEDQRAENASAREMAATWLLKAGEKFSGGLAGPKEKYYQDLYRKATDLERDRRILPDPGHLVSLAEMPSEPSFPKRFQLLSAGLVIATAFASFAALRRDISDQSVRRPRELELLTSEPVLASLPLCRADRRNRVSPFRWTENRPVGAGWESPLVADHARALWARLLLADNHGSARSILVSSSARGEGKTFTTWAVARAAAESGRRVLLIDCNLRGSAVPARSRPGAANGLASILRGEAEPEVTAISTPVQGLELIRAGLAEGDPAMLLLDGNLPKLMNWAKQYDLILLDGPSGFPPEVSILARHADGLVWCVRWGHTLLAEVKADLEELHKQGVRLLGLAVTMVDHKEMRHYQRSPPFM